MNKYKDDILNFLLFGVMIFCIIMSRELNNLDEVWIFNMARNFANGLLPYKDFSIIITPGLPIICGTIMKIFGTEMFIMRILAVILDTVIVFMIYKIIKLFNMNKYLVTFITLLITGLFIESFCIDYNFMVLIIALISMYFELKHYNKTKDIFEYDFKTEVILGILVGTSITMKQTTGICLAIAFIGYKLLAVRSKEELKKFLKIAITRLISVMIPVIMLILYLICNNIMTDFIDYTILGISDFSNSKPYINLLKGDLWTLAVLVPIIIITSFVVSLKSRHNILTVLFAYSISTMIVVYPIADTIHFLIAGTIALITGIYMLVEVYRKKVKDMIKKEDIIWIENFVKSLTIILSIVICIASIIGIVKFLIQCNEYHTFNNFKYIPISEGLEDRILKVDEYIKTSEEEIYILDASAALYMIPLNRYNKNYDMFMTGNFGGKGAEGLINDLESKENATILILNDDYSMNWQTPQNVIKYIKENYIKIGEIEIFDIYKK